MLRKAGNRALITVRKATAADVDAIARVHVASWEAYRGLMPDEDIDRRTVDVRREQWARAIDARERVTLVACDESGVVQGFAGSILLDAAESGFDGYLQTLYLLPAAQRRGIGRILLHAMTEELSDAGLRTMALRVLRLNPARAFYERFGARLAPEGIANDAGTFDSVVYAFDELDVLRKRLEG